MNDIFNVNDINLAKPAQERTLTEFRPNTSRAKDKKKYTAIIRFLPHPFDTIGKTIIIKGRVYLKNPITGKVQYIDTPSSVGLPDPLSDHYWELSKSENAIKRDAAKHFSRKMTYTSLVQVLKCDDEPQLVNKILTWSYGIKVYQKIDKELHPDIGTPHNPFDLLNGRVFVVSVVKVNEFQNFDQCYFCDVEPGQNAVRIKSPQLGPNGEEQFMPITPQMVADERGREYIQKYLQETCPDTTPYEYQPWTAETEAFVEQAFQAYNNPGQMAAMAAQANMQSPFATPTATVVQPATNSMFGTAPQMPGNAPVMPQNPTSNSFGTTAPAATPQPVVQTTAPSTPNIQLGMSSLGDLTAGVAPTQPAAQPAVDPIASLGQLGDDINSLLSGNKGSEDKVPVNPGVANAQSFDDIMGSIF